jgi:hypothetical protein
MRNFNSGRDSGPTVAISSARHRLLARRSFLRLTASVLASGFSDVASSAPDAGGSESATTFVDSVGICLHVGNRQTPYYGSFDKVAPLLKEIGITHLRDDAIYLSYVNRDFDFYQKIRHLAGMGFRFDLICHDALNGYIFTPPRRLADIYDWCDRSVEIFEGANEPQLTRNPALNPAISADHQRSIYTVVKNTPSLRSVIVASPSYIQKNVTLAENLSDAVDWINLHPYPGMEHPETSGPGALRGFIAEDERIFGNRPILVSETGYHTAVQTTKSHLPVSEEIKTRYLPRLLLWNFINGVKKTFIYELIDSANQGLTDPESHFGLTDYDGNPKPSFFAVKQLLSLFNRQAAASTPSPPRLQLDVTGDQRDLLTALFKRQDGSDLWLAWLGVAGWDPAARIPRPPVQRKLALAINPLPQAVTAHLFQDDGTVAAKPLHAVRGELDVTVSDQLTALEIRT